MCSEESSRSCSSRRANNLNLLTVTPAFPIPISPDILFSKLKESTHFTRGRCSSSVFVAEELSPENQSKLFAQDNLWDRLSLVSNDSVSSVSETEKDRQPIDQDKICVQLSDWLIHSMEERKWRQLTEGLDFRNEIDPVLHLGTVSPGTSDIQQSRLCSSPAMDYHREEGNSVFYTLSNEDTSQMATTSRVYDVAVDKSEPLSPPPLRLSPTLTRRRRSSDSHAMRKVPDYWDGPFVKRTSSIQQLIAVLAENLPPSPNALRRAEVLRTFDIPTFRIPSRKWRPPKKLFIFEHSKPMDFITQLALQKHRCAGCGLKLDHVYVKRTLYCHYYLKLFCQCCHQGSKARIPALILHDWNFKEYPPVFNVRLISPGLYRRAKNLRKFRKLRVKVAHMWPFVQMCKLAAELMTENGLTMFSSVPKRFLALESVDVFSLLDFERIANRNLIELVEPLALKGAAHIESCERCRQNAFLCQLCMDPNDLLFPFQVERCHRCDGCGSLTHWKCYRKTTTTNVLAETGVEEVRCEKCERIRRKKFRLQRKASPDRSTCGSE
uniref:Rubicon Homology domain-containing protein n=1 Tax=Globodera rostochiensis TaxID=31243 RepID=A0A914IB73_GLORO